MRCDYLWSIWRATLKDAKWEINSTNCSVSVPSGTSDVKRYFLKILCT